jgi:hypothetical protein
MHRLSLTRQRRVFLWILVIRARARGIWAVSGRRKLIAQNSRVKICLLLGAKARVRARPRFQNATSEFGMKPSGQKIKVKRTDFSRLILRPGMTAIGQYPYSPSFAISVLLSIKILFSCEHLPEKRFASLINRPCARRRPYARTARLRLAHSRAPGIGEDQSARPVS